MGTGITELDVSKNTKLTLIDCADTKISNLDLSNNTALKHYGAIMLQLRNWI